jgi:hypothetical protein
MLRKLYRHYQRLSRADHLCRHSRKRLVLRSSYQNQHSFCHRWFVTEASQIELVKTEFYGNDKAGIQHDILERSIRQSEKKRAKPAYEMKERQQPIEKSSWKKLLIK